MPHYPTPSNRGSGEEKGDRSLASENASGLAAMERADRNSD